MATNTGKRQAPPASADQNRIAGEVILLSPSIQAAAVQERWGKFAGTADIAKLAAALAEQTDAIKAGDLGQAERILFSQATALNTLFTSLAMRAVNQDHIGPLQVFMGLALKAQSQCRTTLETLATLKNPPVVYARQANVTTGPQQINNGAPPPPRTRKNENPPNELLEHTHGNRLDPGTASATGRPDSCLETVGARHRPQD